MVYAVIDTNVFVYALLTKNSDSDTVKIYEAIADGVITPLYHKDILE
jgi:predicted nucleic acid-binding protein